MTIVSFADGKQVIHSVLTINAYHYVTLLTFSQIVNRALVVALPRVTNNGQTIIRRILTSILVVLCWYPHRCGNMISTDFILFVLHWITVILYHIYKVCTCDAFLRVAWNKISFPICILPVGDVADELSQRSYTSDFHRA